MILARKSNNLKLTPVMSLAILALFAMMIPLFSLANNGNRATESQAAAVPTPEPTPYVVEK